MEDDETNPYRSFDPDLSQKESSQTEEESDGASDLDRRVYLSVLIYAVVVAIFFVLGNWLMN